jgi:hypothetical protein
VNQSRLVAHFPEVRLPLIGVYFDVYDVVVTAKLVRDRQAQLDTISDGIVAGHAAVAQIWEHMPEITQSWASIAVCTDNEIQAGLKKLFCVAADMRSTPDRKTCDHASLGIGFQTQPAKLGELRPYPSRPKLCPPETDTLGGSCDDAP